MSSPKHLLLFCLLLFTFLPPSRGQVTILATDQGVGRLGNIIADNSRVYWVDTFNGNVRSVDKINGGLVRTHSSYSPNLYVASLDLCQEVSFLYLLLPEPTNNIYKTVFKLSKTSLSVSMLDRSGVYRNGDYALAMHPNYGSLYYVGANFAWPDFVDSWDHTVVSQSTLGGTHTRLTSTNPVPANEITA